jgi:hypothetical protein
VDRHAAGINGGHAGECRDGQPLPSVGLDLVQESSFAATRLASQKKTLVGVADVFKRQFKLRVRLQVYRSASRASPRSITP